MEKRKLSYTLKRNYPLSEVTRIHLGGKCSRYMEFRDLYNTNIDRLNFLEYIKNTKFKYTNEFEDLKVPFFLGNGSDVLFSDKKYIGDVVKISSNGIFILENYSCISDSIPETRSNYDLKQGDKSTASLNLSSIYFKEDKSNPVYVFAESGVRLSYLIQYTLEIGFSGLHWFSYIPANVSGAIYNNVHGGIELLSNYIDAVVVLKNNREIKLLSNNELDFGYDKSIFQKDKSIVILGAIFKLYKQENINIYSDFSKNWIKQKVNVQPKGYSLGSTFKNFSEEEKLKYNLPSISAGYLIDSCNLKGFRINNAYIYEKHANFFINEGTSSEDYNNLIEYAIKKVKEQYNVTLIPEVIRVNF